MKHIPNNYGSCRFMCYESNMTQQLFMDFLERLVHDSDRKVLFIVDNLKVHHGKFVQEWLNNHKDALEEALVNAVFHKSYREAEPVEMRIYVDSIQILNYPGLAKRINLERFVAGKVKGRK